MTPEKLAAEILAYTLSPTNGERWEPSDQWLKNVAAIIRKHEHDREAELRRAIECAIADLEQIVCVTEPDDGVVLLDHQGTTHWDAEHKIQVYDCEHFSPLGDALIALHDKLTAALNPKGPTQ